MGLVRDIYTFDDVLHDPHAWRARILEGNFGTYSFPEATFHGINTVPPNGELIAYIQRFFPDFKPTLTFARRSPEGQVEPHFIHTDIDMGDWSAILYLNPERPAGDGTDFWTYLGTNAIESFIPHERSNEGRDPKGWMLRRHVWSRFNRLLVFPSSYFHSRAIFDNWGQGDDARLVQVVFGKGEFA